MEASRAAGLEKFIASVARFLRLCQIEERNSACYGVSGEEYPLLIRRGCAPQNIDLFK